MHVLIIGSGSMGRQLSALMLRFGFKVSVLTKMPPDEYHIELRKTIRRNFNLRVEPCDSPRVGHKIEQFSDLDLVIETTLEDEGYKANLMTGIEERFDKLPILTNTSSLDPRKIGSNVGVLHFMNPVTIKVVEYIPSIQTIHEKELLARLANDGYLIVHAPLIPGFAVNRILFGKIKETLFILEKSPSLRLSDINALYESMAWGKNPIEYIDMIGPKLVEDIIENIFGVGSAPAALVKFNRDNNRPRKFTQYIE